MNQNTETTVCFVARQSLPVNYPAPIHSWTVVAVVRDGEFGEKLKEERLDGPMSADDAAAMVVELNDWLREKNVRGIG